MPSSFVRLSDKTTCMYCLSPCFEFILVSLIAWGQHFFIVPISQQSMYIMPVHSLQYPCVDVSQGYAEFLCKAFRQNNQHVLSVTLFRIYICFPDSMGPTWGPSGADRTQVGPILAPWTLLSGFCCQIIKFKFMLYSFQLCASSRFRWMPVV